MACAGAANPQLPSNQNGISGIRFTPDGLYVIGADYFNQRLAMFSIDGTFVRFIGAGKSTFYEDVEFKNDELIMAGMFQRPGSTTTRVYIYDPSFSGKCALAQILSCCEAATVSAGYLSFGPIEKQIMVLVFVTSACARRTGAAARVER